MSFSCISHGGRTTLGRGGSDRAAVRLQQGSRRTNLVTGKRAELKRAGGMTGGRATAEVDLASQEPIDDGRTARARPTGRRPPRRRCASGWSPPMRWPSRSVWCWRSPGRRSCARTTSSACSAAPRRWRSSPCPCGWSSLSLNKLYLARAVARADEEIRRIVNASFISVGVIVAVAFALQFKSLSRLWVLSMLVFVPCCLIVERTIARRIFTRLRRTGDPDPPDRSSSAPTPTPSA